MQETIMGWITALGTAAMAVAFFWGLYIWKQQLKGTAQFDAARGLLKEVYALKRDIGSARSSLSSPNPNFYTPTEPEDMDKLREERARFAEARATYNERLGKVSDFYSRAEFVFYEAEILIGDREMKEHVRPIAELCLKLKAGVTEYFDSADPDKRSGRSPEEVEALNRKALQIRPLLVEDITNPEQDEFKKEIDAAFDRLETFLKPYLFNR